LTDVGQNRKRKLSMYDLGKDIGLPAAFIDLRHQIIHDNLPGLVVLRQNAHRAVKWLYQHYWKDVGLEVPITVDHKLGNGREKTEAMRKAALEKVQHQHRFRPSGDDENISWTLHKEKKTVVRKEKEVSAGITFELPDRRVFVPGAVGAEPIDSS